MFGALGQEPLLLVVIFILFVFALRKLLEVVKTALFVVAASVLFPVVLNFLGFSVGTDSATLVYFITLGLGLYALWLFGTFIYHALSAAEKSAQSTLSPLRKALGGKKKRAEEEE